MKRRHLSRADWGRILRREDRLHEICRDGFCGVVHAIRMLRVREPLVHLCCGQELLLADDGYVWLTGMEWGKDFAVTCAFDADGRPVQWYFDVLERAGRDQGGPFMDDLYLDILLMPDGRREMVDEDELLEALRQGEITKAQFDAAWATARRLLRELDAEKERYEAVFREVLQEG